MYYYVSVYAISCWIMNSTKIPKQPFYKILYMYMSIQLLLQ